jgi:hypothetical protein
MALFRSWGWVADNRSAVVKILAKEWRGCKRRFVGDSRKESEKSWPLTALECAFTGDQVHCGGAPLRARLCLLLTAERWRGS